jgi:beta-lactam-binding protein with PASTA domain
MKLVAAVRELVAGDCKRGKVTYAYSPKVKKGRVIKQSARPGKTLTAGSKVSLVVSKGKKR